MTSNVYPSYTKTLTQASSVNRDFYREVDLGNVPGYSLVTIVSSALNVGTTRRTLWHLNQEYSFLTSGTTVTVSSESSDDSSGGIGATQVIVFYLDSNLEENVEIINLDGTNGVSLNTSDFYRMQEIIVSSAGSTGENQGNIYVGNGAISLGVPANIYGMIPVGRYNRMQTNVYTVPVGYKIIFISNYFSTSTNKPARLLFGARNFVSSGVFTSTGNFNVSDFTEIQSGFSGFGPVTSGIDIITDVASESGTITEINLTTRFLRSPA